MTFPWTPEQQAIFSTLRDTDDSLLVIAVAGSGKTKTLEGAVDHLSGSILAIAFNVKTAKTLEEKIGKKAICKTVNSIGHSVLKDWFNGWPKLEKDKLGDIIIKMLKDGDDQTEDSAIFWERLGPAAKLAQMAKLHGIVPKGSPGLFKTLTDDHPTEWESLAEHYDIHYDNATYLLAHEALIRSNTQAFKQNIIDFSDQLYLPVCWGMNFSRFHFDNILIDEIQDLSTIQHAMISAMCKPLLKGKSTRIIAVGDPDQTIYGWRGAAESGVEKLKETFNLQELGLTVSFRCCQSVVTEARNMVPRIQSAPDAPIGVVSTVGRFDETLFAPGDVIICRNNAPNLKMAYKLLGSGLKVQVLGRDIGAGLKTLINKLSKKNKQMSMEEFSDHLESWKFIETSRAEQRKQWNKLESISDKATSLKVILNNSSASTTGELIREIDTLFSAKTAPITLSTVHKFKGLESDRVFILEPDLIPSIWAQRAALENPEKSGWMLREERNIRYVAVTRAKTALYYITLNGWRESEVESPS